MYLSTIIMLLFIIVFIFGGAAALVYKSVRNTSSEADEDECKEEL